MGAMLVATGLLLLGSAWAKWRAGTRMGTGVQPLTLLEILTGILALALSGAGPLGAGAARLLVPTGVLLLFVSSGVFFRRLRDERRRRALSESRRLEAFVKYLHQAQASDEEAGDDELPPDARPPGQRLDQAPPGDVDLRD